MSRFALAYPFLIIVLCLMVCVVGLTSLLRMPVDLFPEVKIPVVVVATFYPGMPAEQIENDITGRFERFFTMGSGIDHIESSSKPGVSLIKVYFQPGEDANAAVTAISNLAMANLRRLPPGTLPPVVLKFDASSLPVCLITLKADGLTEAAIRDLAQYQVRNQVANIPGAAVPQPFGGRYRQIMVYVDPAKLDAYHLSVMDVVRSVNESSLILPSGDVKVGAIDYNIFTNSQVDAVSAIDDIPLRAMDGGIVTIGDVAQAKDASQIQANIVRVDGQPSVYLPILRQGGGANTIAIVNGVRNVLANLVDVPASLKATLAFDQSTFVTNAISNLVHEGIIGLALTSFMILVFLGSLLATSGVFFSIPLSVLASFIILAMGGNTINTMILGGLALAFSRLIDNSVVVLENIFRHLEEGTEPREAAYIGGREVALPVLAATLTTAIVFFPVTLLFGVSKYLFEALALSVVLSLLASYVVAMTVVPLFCATFIRSVQHENIGHAGLGHAGSGHTGQLEKPVKSWLQRLGSGFNAGFNRRFETMLRFYDRGVQRVLNLPRTSLVVLLMLCAAPMLSLPWLGLAYFPRTDAGQFIITIKAPTGTRVEVTSDYVAQAEAIIHAVIPKSDLANITSNIGLAPGFSAIYTTNTASHSAFIQVELTAERQEDSYTYMNRVREELHSKLPQLTTYFQSGGIVDAVVNLGLPAPIDIQIRGSNLELAYKTATDLAQRIRAEPGVSDVFIPQDIDAPSLRIDVDRDHAKQMGLSQHEVVSNIITALSSNQMIAPTYWVDPKSGNDYLLTVQYPENQIKSLDDMRGIPMRSADHKDVSLLGSVASIKPMIAPTVVSHYQLGRVIDIYVAPQTESLRFVGNRIEQIIKETQLPPGQRINVRGSISAMNDTFNSFAIGLGLSVILVYLVLVAQFRSFVDPFIILLAVPPGIAGALATLVATGTTLNVMSLMGMVMMVGIVVSNSILIVEFAHHIKSAGKDAGMSVAIACRVRLRPILMTSLATIFGLIPMSLGLSAGSESYASLARVVIGGLTVSVVVTIFLVPAAFGLVYASRSNRPDQLVEANSAHG
jgi:multidrug efflux pump subunit AcrB